MGLLKGDASVKNPNSIMPSPGMTFSDFLSFWMALWVSLIVGLPILLIIVSVIFYVGLMIFGGVLGSL